MKRKIILLLLFLGFLFSNNLKAQNDSLHQKISIVNKTRVGGYFRVNEFILGVNTFMLLSKNRTYESGIGSGIEIVNRGSDFISITQIPFIWTNHFYPDQENIYFLFEAGYIVPIGASYLDDIANIRVDLTTTQLKGTPVVNFGIGFTSTDQKYFGEISLRNQNMGITYPVNDNYLFLGINIGFRL